MSSCLNVLMYVLQVLFKTYWFELFQAHLCKLVYDLLQFVSPILLNVLISYTSQKAEIEAAGQQWKGYVYASSFFVTTFLGSILFNQNFHIGMSLGMRVKSALISAVYKKVSWLLFDTFVPGAGFHTGSL